MAENPTNWEVDLTGAKTKSDVYSRILDALHAPSWHGHNLDAINDTFSGGVSGFNPGDEIFVSGTADLPEEAATLLHNIQQVAAEAATEQEIQPFMHVRA